MDPFHDVLLVADEVDLKHVLDHNRRNSKLKTLSDRNYNELLKELFDIIRVERSSYLKSARGGEDRLSSCADALRIIVDHGVKAFRRKHTAPALLSHILLTLPLPNGHFCEPIAKPYTKVLRTFLEYRPHAEHLQEEEWRELISLCLGGIKSRSDLLDGQDEEEALDIARAGRRPGQGSRSGTPSTVSFPARSIKRSLKRSVNGLGDQIVEDLFVCLSLLLSVPHLPVLDISGIVYEALHEFLKDTAPSAQLQSVEYAIKSINAILAWSITEDLDLSTRITQEVVPQIRRLWHSKAHQGLKDQMLLLLLYCEDIMQLVFAENEDFRDELDRLLDVLRKEYAKRKDLDLLSCEDLILGPLGVEAESRPMMNAIFRLRIGSARAEQAWALLSCMAKVSGLLRYERKKGISAAHDGNLQIANKRRKVEAFLDTVTDSINKASGSEKAAYLQMIAFISLEQPLNTEERKRLCDIILPLISREETSIASWSLLTLACISQNTVSGTLEPSSEAWVQCWKLSARAMTSPSLCRPACHLLVCLSRRNLVNYDEISSTMDSMLSSVDLSGPGLLCDSSVYLWCSLLTVKASRAPAFAYQASQRISQWLYARWRPAAVILTVGTKKTLPIFDTEDIIHLLATVLGLSRVHGASLSYAVPGLLAKAKAKQLADRPILDFLLLISESKSKEIHKQDEAEDSSTTVEFSDFRFQALCKDIFDFLSNEINSTVLAGILDVVNTKLGEELFRTVTQLGIVASALLSNRRVQKLTKVGKLSEDVLKLRSQIFKSVMSQDQPSVATDGLISAFDGLLKFGKPDIVNAGAHSMAQEFGPEFWHKMDVDEDEETVDDLLIVEDSLESQNSRARSETQDTSRNRRIPRSSVTTQSCRTNQIARICLASITKFASGDDLIDKKVGVRFVEYVTGLKAQDFLFCRSLFLDLFEAKASIDAGSTLTILEYLGQELLQPDEFERCESALSMTLDLMTGLADIWTTAEGDLQSAASQLYEWYIEVALPKRILSPTARVCMANMLRKVIELKPDYAKDLSLESTRTSLFRIFEEGTAKVKFCIGVQIPSIFKFFVLKEHDAILDDIVSSLPLEPEWVEGSALRIYILAKLGASWSTLLRRCIFAIVEASALVPACSAHVRRCFEQLARDLDIGQPKDLFKLFASQIIYTWLDTKGLSTIPFSILGYSSLKELLDDVHFEVTAQIVMRGRESEIQELARFCQRPTDEMLKEAFGRCAAYCIARDASVPPDADRQAAGGAVRLRNLVGKDYFGSLLLNNFPETLSILFKIADREESISKGFQRHDTFFAASHAYDEILSSGASQTPLIVSQQPSFKASYLLDEIDFLCTRTDLSADAMWSSALYTYVFRELLDTVHPALGSLHTCSVIRRLRILVSMAGDAALQDYPLEMALHSLRRFLIDTQCSEDVIGLFRYLISHGLTYLQQVPSFLTGFVVSTLVSLRAFLESPRDSTTQESQYIATMSKAKEFHGWLGSLMTDYTTPLLSSFETETLKRIVHTAVQVRAAGNSRLDTPESELLSMILEDDQSGRKLIDHSSRGIILNVLCSEFGFSPNFRDDILGNDNAAARCAPVLLRTVMQRQSESNYVRWVCRVLGRAYAATGGWSQIISRRGTDEMTLESSELSLSHQSQQSRTSILRFLQRTLYTDDLGNIGDVERTLREIIAHTSKKDNLFDCIEELPPSLLSAISWDTLSPPRTRTQPRTLEAIPTLTDALQARPDVPYHLWIKKLSLALARTCPGDPLLSAFVPILESIEGVAEQLFPQILHLALVLATGKQNVKGNVSAAASQWLNDFSQSLKPHAQQIFKAILYLRSQPMPQEGVKSDRAHWLDIDFGLAADVASRCGMYTTSLLFLEISVSEASRNSSRRSSVAAKPQVPEEILLRIYQNLDDKDCFYGIRQPSSLDAMMHQLEFENAGFKSLSFRGAHYDSQIRYLGGPDQTSETDIIKLLDAVDLNGVSQALISTVADQALLAQDAMFMTARKLERWDITGPSDATSPPTILFKAFQNLYDSADQLSITKALDTGFAKTLASLMQDPESARNKWVSINTLAVLTEIEDVVSSKGIEQLFDAHRRLQNREEWMLLRRYEDVKTIDSCRNTLFSTVSKSKDLRTLMKVSEKDARIVEVQALLASSGLNRRHGALQSSLKSATYLAQLVDSCAELGLRVDVAANFEASNVLWDQGEMISSIRMLQDIVSVDELRRQDIQVGKPKVLATLGHRISEARLEKPDEIIANYLGPAIAELKGTLSGSEAGQVFHEFASFCDKQLQNPDSLEDFRRIESLRARKENEIRDLDIIVKSAGSQQKERDVVKNARSKAKKWFDLDNREYQRLKQERRALLSQSLENYLLCLRASDEYSNDALRFSSLWLEYSEEDVANTAVKKQIQHVASRKFAPLIHQWISRQLDVDSEFQNLLSDLILRICNDHPFHGMYHLFTSSKSKGVKDPVALSRNAAALKVVSELKAHKRTAPTWIAIHNSNVNYVRFAGERVDKAKQGMKVALSALVNGRKMEQDTRSNQIPPPTMKIDLRADCDYSSLPTIHKYSPSFSFASGISMPKVLTAIASDGRKYKQLYKSGNDDLRQDAIMEQVFEQVSNLLRHHGETRQRNLGIRTYKVLPLTATAGIIEWVTDTVPLNDYLMPAHQAHYPRDMKQSVCRKTIAEAQSKPTETRIKTFREVCDKFHPVLRFFLLDRFLDPDEWFEKRLMYTRSTAAISMLGYILGLGDRHGQNILLDEKTGEVVHIDLGIAFETGRVLPVPELVPFRLTRDIVDGMGITKTEGVFRRCCEFTLDALRKEEYSIMTILDVLRYDPLVSWSVSPLKMKRMQEDQEEVGEDDAEGKLRARRKEDGKAGTDKSEEGEAERALTVVKKKLSKSLSVAATVNELIQQATDEHNLALLFAGWAAYA